ncbi:3-hydroxyisobutyrate dehydrogenase [cyanobacterium TDX16]|nr:3-hydroxyisobutyrate dehydrogenase [cyanobacterium TDX16]
MSAPETTSNGDGPSSEAPTVGFIGLGQIGAPLATHLLRWPGGLVVCDVRPEATEPFVEQGASAVPDAATLGGEAGIIQVMVLDDDQVRSVVDDILPVAEPGTVIAIHSTIRPETAEQVAADAAEADVLVVDAPVSGGFMGAHEGNLAVMVGGPDEAVEAVREPFALWSDLLVHAGPRAGDGTRMKLARNLITFAGFSAALEGAQLAAAAGISVKDLGDVVRHSDRITGGAGAIMMRDAVGPLDADDGLYDIFGHTRTLGEKDLHLAATLGEQLGVELPFTRLALERFAENLGRPHDDGDD